MTSPGSWPSFIWKSLQGNSVTVLVVFVMLCGVYLWACPKAPADVDSRLARVEAQVVKVSELEKSLNENGRLLEGLQEKLNAVRENLAEQKVILKEMQKELREAYAK